MVGLSGILTVVGPATPAPAINSHSAHLATGLEWFGSNIDADYLCNSFSIQVATALL